MGIFFNLGNSNQCMCYIHLLCELLLLHPSNSDMFTHDEEKRTAHSFLAAISASR